MKLQLWEKREIPRVVMQEKMEVQWWEGSKRKKENRRKEWRYSGGRR